VIPFSVPFPGKVFAQKKRSRKEKRKRGRGGGGEELWKSGERLNRRKNTRGRKKKKPVRETGESFFPEPEVVRWKPLKKQGPKKKKE